MYATDVRQHHRLMPHLGGGGIIRAENLLGCQSIETISVQFFTSF